MIQVVLILLGFISLINGNVVTYEQLVGKLYFNSNNGYLIQVNYFK